MHDGFGSVLSAVLLSVTFPAFKELPPFMSSHTHNWKRLSVQNFTFPFYAVYQILWSLCCGTSTGFMASRDSCFVWRSVCACGWWHTKGIDAWCSCVRGKLCLHKSLLVLLWWIMLFAPWDAGSANIWKALIWCHMIWKTLCKCLVWEY